MNECHLNKKEGSTAPAHLLPNGDWFSGMGWTGGWASRRPRRERQIEAEIDRYASYIRAATPADDERERDRGEGTHEHQATRGTTETTREGELCVCGSAVRRRLTELLPV